MRAEQRSSRRSASTVAAVALVARLRRREDGARRRPRAKPGSPERRVISPRNGARQTQPRGRGQGRRSKTSSWRRGGSAANRSSARATSASASTASPTASTRSNCRTRDRQPDRQGAPGRRLLRLPRVRGAQRRACRADRLRPAATRPRPGRRSTTTTCAPASTGSSSPWPRTTARPTPFHAVTNFQILPSDRTTARSAWWQGLQRQGRARSKLDTPRQSGGPILHFV